MGKESKRKEEKQGKRVTYQKLSKGEFHARRLAVEFGNMLFRYPGATTKMENGVMTVEYEGNMNYTKENMPVERRETEEEEEKRLEESVKKFGLDVTRCKNCKIVFKLQIE